MCHLKHKSILFSNQHDNLRREVENYLTTTSKTPKIKTKLKRLPETKQTKNKFYRNTPTTIKGTTTLVDRKK